MEWKTGRHAQKKSAEQKENNGAKMAKKWDLGSLFAIFWALCFGPWAIFNFFSHLFAILGFWCVFHSTPGRLTHNNRASVELFLRGQGQSSSKRNRLKKISLFGGSGRREFSELCATQFSLGKRTESIFGKHRFSKPHTAAKGVRQKESGKKVTEKVTEASEQVTKSDRK